MGYLNGHSNSIETSQKGEKGERGVGFSLTADKHYHLNNKRSTEVKSDHRSKFSNLSNWK